MENSFTFTRDMIVRALKANGWYTLCNDDYWVHKSYVNPDYSGVTLMDAFKQLLRKSNLF